MSLQELLKRTTIGDAAAILELHPFDVIRILTTAGPLPKDLRIEATDIDRIRELGKIESWWDLLIEPDTGESEVKSVLRTMMRRMLDSQLVDPEYTRSDNLFRGLQPDLQLKVRKGVNLLIRERILLTRMSPTGLHVAANRPMLPAIKMFAESGTGALDALIGPG